jgi:putative MATE family efflux protein
MLGYFYVMARDLTQGSIPRHVIALAIPALFSMFAIVLNNLIDTGLVGHLGAAQVAAVGSAGFVVWLIFSIMDVFAVGTVAMISRHYGAGELDAASEEAKHIIHFAALFSIVFAVLGVIFSHNIYHMLNLAPDVERMGRVYLQIIFLAAPSLFIAEAIGAVFRAVGDTTTPMIFMISAVASNIVLDILLIYGVWIFPRLETMGAAIATSTAHTLALFIALFFVLKGKLPFRILPRPYSRINFSIIWKMVKIGMPTSLASINFAFVYLAMTRIMSEFGTVAVAAIPVGNRAESLSYMTCFGFYMAASTMVGQNLGAKQPERASKAAWTTLAIITSITFVYGLIFYIFSRQIPSILTNDPNVIEIASSYLRIIAFSQVFMALEFVLEGAFAGAGNTMPPMIVSIPGTLIRIPLSYFLALKMGFGPSGIFLAITISTIIKGIAILIWFRTGRWKTKLI